MSEKRRDNKGRILRTGESQRKNGMYEFRYTDANKKRRSIYDMDLMKLRQKEDEIKLMRHEGIDYAGGEITVIQLLERYISLKRGVRYNTTTGYKFVMSVVKKEAFGQRIIRDIKMSDAKLWFIKLYDDGYSYSTIASIRGVVKPAFQMAYTEDIIRRNPFESVWILSQTIHRKELHCPQSSRSSFLSLPRMTNTSADIGMKSRYCLEQECESVSFAD